MPKKSSTIVSTLVSAAIEKLAPRMTQKELSLAMGFSTPNMLSMLRTGDAKVPFAKIPVIAAVLDIDPALLFRFHLREQWPEFEDVVFEIFGGVLTRAEREWVEFFSDLDVKLPTTAVKRKELKTLLRVFATKSS